MDNMTFEAVVAAAMLDVQKTRQEADEICDKLGSIMQAKYICLQDIVKRIHNLFKDIAGTEGAALDIKIGDDIYILTPCAPSGKITVIVNEGDYKMELPFNEPTFEKYMQAVPAMPDSIKFAEDLVINSKQFGPQFYKKCQEDLMALVGTLVSEAHQRKDNAEKAMKRVMSAK